jgi:hypothetical protein
MGGQACVFYGAAQVSKDIDLVLLADSANFQKLLKALDSLGAKRIAVPQFSSEVLARGHVVHFRCSAPGVEDLRVDVMTRLRDLPDFPSLWERRTVKRTILATSSIFSASRISLLPKKLKARRIGLLSNFLSPFTFARTTPNLGPTGLNSGCVKHEASNS